MDVVRYLVQTLDRMMPCMRCSSCEKFAATLGRAGWRISKESVRRYRHEPRAAPNAAGFASAVSGFARGGSSNHVWLIGVTQAQIKALFGLFFFQVAAVFDAFSRMPLAVHVIRSAPTRWQMARLVA